MIHKGKKKLYEEMMNMINKHNINIHVSSRPSCQYHKINNSEWIIARYEDEDDVSRYVKYYSCPSYTAIDIFHTVDGYKMELDKRYFNESRKEVI